MPLQTDNKWQKITDPAIKTGTDQNSDSRLCTTSGTVGLIQV